MHRSVAPRVTHRHGSLKTVHFRYTIQTSKIPLCLTDNNKFVTCLLASFTAASPHYWRYVFLLRLPWVITTKWKWHIPPPIEQSSISISIITFDIFSVPSLYIVYPIHNLHTLIEVLHTTRGRNYGCDSLGDRWAYFQWSFRCNQIWTFLLSIITLHFELHTTGKLLK